MSGKVVVAGALGLVGRAVVDHFEKLGGWTIVGLSRRSASSANPAAQHFSVDLTDAEDCRSKLGGLTGVTHLVYAALFEKPELIKGWLEADHMATNQAMFANFLDTLLPGNPGLRHVSLLQGAKAYGAHLGPMKAPAREREPRHIHPNFYWLQEDHLKMRQAGRPWTWTIFRPQFIFGFAVGSPMNVLSALGVYAAISRERGLPLAFPGQGPSAVIEFTDARLIGRAIEWAGRSQSAAAEAFNITNGDVIAWEDSWPEIARHFRMEVGARQPMSLAAVMPSHEAAWAGIQRKYGLAPYRYDEVVGTAWQFADSCFGFGAGAPHSHLSTIKIRQAGFHDCIDSTDMLIELLEELESRKIIPDPALFESG
jgi:nucleoside-diphosphate-sugar epimerase